MRRLALTTALCLAALLAAAAARGELAQRGTLRLSFDGRFAPRALPRRRPAPLTVRLSGTIATTDGSRPPRLRTISIEVNRHGRVSTRGLPVCPAGLLEQTSSSVALARCRGALIGPGRFEAGVGFAGEAPFPVEGRMLAFNGRAAGRPAILMHVYGRRPIEATVVLSFRIAHPRRGEFGTVISTRIPQIAADAGYITGVSFSFGRRYRYRGARRSFLSAACAAPPGFPGAVFNFARGRFGFADGQTVPITLSRDCSVRR
jgi:hypothetical protein